MGSIIQKKLVARKKSEDGRRGYEEQEEGELMFLLNYS